MTEPSPRPPKARALNPTGKPKAMRVLTYTLQVTVVIDDGDDLEKKVANAVEFTPGAFRDYCNGGEAVQLRQMAKELGAVYRPGGKG